jgi:dUTP pyrophosphatase
MNTLNICPDESVYELYSKKSNYNTDSGFDLFCPDSMIIPPKSIATIDFKIKCSPNFEKLSGYYLYPRSSISKTPLMMANSVGIIDHSYRGNIMAKVYNTSDIPFQINRGERLFQICMPTLQPFDVSFVNALDSTERGSGGFGSTG